MTTIVYRKLPDIPHRQYVRRIVGGYWLLWHRDKAVALRMERKDAKALADVLGCAVGRGYDHTGRLNRSSHLESTALRRCYHDTRHIRLFPNAYAQRALVRGANTVAAFNRRSRLVNAISVAVAT